MKNLEITMSPFVLVVLLVLLVLFTRKAGGIHNKLNHLTGNFLQLHVYLSNELIN